MAVADDAISFALSQVGKPYRYGARGPDAYDCSGLIDAAFRAAGHPFPLRATTGLLLSWGQSITRAQLAPGDLVFPDAGHVQLYLGAGEVVEAPHTGLNVRVAPAYGYAYCRRLVPPSTLNYVTGGASQSGSIHVVPAEITMPTDPSTGKTAVPPPSGTFGNPLTALGNVFKPLLWITQPHNWLRIALFVAGAALLLSQLVDINKLASNAGKVVSNGTAKP